MKHQTSGDAEVRHQQHRCNVGVVVAQCTDGDVELVDRDLFENRPVKVVAVNDVDVEMSSGFEPASLFARWSSRSRTVTLAPCFNQSSAIFVPMGEAPTMMTWGCQGSRRSHAQT